MKILYFTFNLFNYHCFFLFILFLHNCYDSLSTIETGFYPYVKRLNDGSYIIISSTRISFVDETFTEIIKDNPFSGSKYSNRQTISSTIVAQYSHRNNDYVVAIVEKAIYIFSFDGNILAGGSDYTDVIKDTQYPCSLILDNNVENNNYYFTVIITLNGGNSCANNCNSLKFTKMKFIPSGTSGSLSYISEASFSIPSPTLIYAYLKCDTMISNSQEYIACFYGNEQNIFFTLFNFNYEEVNSKIYTFDSSINQGGHVFNAVVMPTTRAKALICGYNNNYFCIDYDITTNSFGTISTPIGNTNNMCSNEPSALTIEYFYEAERFIVGCLGSSKYHLAELDNDFNTRSQSIDNTTPSSSYLVRLNIIFPTNSNSFSFFTHYDSNQQNLQTTLGEITVNKLHDYPKYGQYTQNTLICEKYYNYEHNGCETDVPEGYYPNSTEDKTIDKCYNSCKTCSTGGTAINHNCQSCKESGQNIII